MKSTLEWLSPSSVNIWIIIIIIIIIITSDVIGEMPSV